MKTVTVLFPIRVPEGKYCWKGVEGICERFDNEGGHVSCDLGFWQQTRTPEGDVLKPAACLELEEQQT